MSETVSQLLPCPFCGDSAQTAGFLAQHVVECTSCNAETGACDSVEEAVERWNTRAFAPEAATASEALRPEPKASTPADQRDKAVWFLDNLTHYKSHVSSTSSERPPQFDSDVKKVEALLSSPSSSIGGEVEKAVSLTILRAAIRGAEDNDGTLLTLRELQRQAARLQQKIAGNPMGYTEGHGALSPIPKGRGEEPPA